MVDHELAFLREGADAGSECNSGHQGKFVARTKDVKKHV